MTITCNNVSIKIKNGKEIVRNLSFVLNDFDKLAIIGEEGNGKSTLLQFFYQPSLIEEFTEAMGNFSLTAGDIAYLPQQLDSRWNNHKIFDFLFKKELDGDIDYDHYNDLFTIEKYFTDLKLTHLMDDENRIIGNCSGGEKIKLSLIKLFLYQPKLYLLDEPTNDLDLFTLEYLEQFLIASKTPIIFVSHDISMLKKVANQILHLEQIKRKTEMKFTLYKGGYENYLQDRETAFSKLELAHYRTKKEKERKIDILRHQHLLVENHLDNATGSNPSEGRILAKKMANIKANEKKAEAMEVVEEPRPEETINCFFNKTPPIPSKKCLCQFNEEKLQIGNLVLLEKFDFECYGPKHIVITGDNGSGKTTLLRKIKDELSTVSRIKVGYMPQNYEEMLDMASTPVTYLQGFLGYDKATQAKIMNCLAAMRFEPDEMNKPIKEISGGQKAKLYLIMMILTDVNVLLLDEPTRNLSPLSVPKIIQILKEFSGAIISVSHDRTYIDGVGEIIYQIQDQRLIKTKF